MNDGIPAPSADVIPPDPPPNESHRTIQSDEIIPVIPLAEITPANPSTLTPFDTEHCGIEQHDELRLIDLQTEGYHSVSDIVRKRVDGDHDDDAVFVPEVTKNPKLIKRLSIIKFASAEKLMTEFRSLLPTLRKLVYQPDFDQLFYCNSAKGKRGERQRVFIAPIISQEFERKVK